jgi:hypothetical protein
MRVQSYLYPILRSCQPVNAPIRLDNSRVPGIDEVLSTYEEFRSVCL